MWSDCLNKIVGYFPLHMKNSKPVGEIVVIVLKVTTEILQGFFFLLLKPQIAYKTWMKLQLDKSISLSIF